MNTSVPTRSRSDANAARTSLRQPGPVGCRAPRRIDAPPTLGPRFVSGGITSTQQYLTTDRAGSITDATTNTGGTSGIACALRYDPFGNTIADNTNTVATTTCTSGSTISDTLYHSTRQDATTGDYQFGSRTYDPTKSTFTTPDTYRNAPRNADLSVGTDPLTQNTYTYVNGDPINLADADGHRACAYSQSDADALCSDRTVAGMRAQIREASAALPRAAEAANSAANWVAANKSRLLEAAVTSQQRCVQFNATTLKTAAQSNGACGSLGTPQFIYMQGVWMDVYTPNTGSNDRVVCTDSGRCIAITAAVVVGGIQAALFSRVGPGVSAPTDPFDDSNTPFGSRFGDFPPDKTVATTTNVRTLSGWRPADLEASIVRTSKQ